MNGWLIARSAPAAPQPAAATINMVRLVEVTLAPELRAATSLSRTDDKTSPNRLRSNIYVATTTMRATNHAARYVSWLSSAKAILLNPGR